MNARRPRVTTPKAKARELLFRGIITGPIPSKKNNRGISRGRIYIKEDDRAAISWIVRQLVMARAKISLREPILGHVTVVMQMLNSGRKDIDNMLTTILDCLQEARIIENDRQVRGIFIDAEPGVKTAPLTTIQIFSYKPQWLIQ